MSESSLWDQTRIALHGLDPVRVENAAGVGTPDVNYIEGWLELKWIEKWPVRETTLVKLEHYKPEQKAWHMRRCWSGGKCDVLLQVDKEILLIPGDVAAQQLGKLNKAELLKVATAHWANVTDLKRTLRDALNKKPAASPTK